MGVKMYSIDFIGNITRDSDGATIPIDANNIDYHNYLTWVDEGNTPRSYAPPVASPKEQAKVELAATDKEMARIAEDLIQTLISKGVIAESDIPASARDKMDRRAKLRAGLA